MKASEWKDHTIVFNDRIVNKYIKVLVYFHSGKRKTLPSVGYRPDAVFDKDYWGITFIELNVENFNVLSNATIAFTFVEEHYDEVYIGQEFSIREGAHEVGKGTILEIVKD